VEVVCGGFPCTDLSAGATARSVKGRNGLDGDASGLWREFARIVGECRPTFVVVENVDSGRADWLPFVRRDLWSLGYASVPLRVRASDVGAPHRRSRVFVVGYPIVARLEGHVVEVVARAAQEAVNAARLPGGVAWLADGGDVLPGSCLRRAGDGVRSEVDRARLKALGNAVVPQVGEVIGRVVVALRDAMEAL
jgi:DNA (cytosine-5)-methyltransferase 1